VTVRMRPSDAMFADVMLNVPKELQNVVLSLNEGDLVEFEGTLRSQGGHFSYHTVDAARLSKQ